MLLDPRQPSNRLGMGAEPISFSRPGTTGATVPRGRQPRAKAPQLGRCVCVASALVFCYGCLGAAGA